MTGIAGLGYAAGWRLLRFAPKGLATRAFRAGADLAAHRDGAGTRQLRRNLARVVPDATPAEFDALVRDGLRSYARYWQEVFLLPSANHDALVDRIDGGHRSGGPHQGARRGVATTELG